MSAESKPNKKGRFSAEEKAAVFERIAEMPQPDRAMAERLHAVVTDAAPKLLLPTPWSSSPMTVPPPSPSSSDER